jgi:hypothetical protein
MTSENELSAGPAPNDATYGSTLRAPRLPRTLLLAAVVVLAALAISPAAALAAAPSLQPHAANAPHAGVITTPSPAIAALSTANAKLDIQRLAAAAKGPRLAVPASALAGHVGMTSTVALARSELGLEPNALGVHPDGSTAANWNVTADAQDSDLQSVGTGNQTLIESSTSYLDLFNGSSNSSWGSNFYSPSSWFTDYGTFQIERSTNAGQTWTTNLLAANSSWLNDPSNASYGDVNLFEGAIAAGTDNEVIAADQYGQPCEFLFYQPTASDCQSPAGFNATEGIAVATSTDGGVTFGATQVLASYDTINFDHVTVPQCTGTFEVGGNYTIGAPVVTINSATGNGTVAWQENYENAQGWVYNSTLGGCEYFTNIQAQVWTSSTTNGGVTWSTPVSHGGNETYGPALATIPSSGKIVLLQVDLNNISHGFFSVGYSDSVDGGSTWTVMHDITGITYNPVQVFGAFYPDSSGWTDNFWELQESFTCSGNLPLSSTQNNGPVFGIYSSPCPSAPAFSVAASPTGDNIYVTWNDGRYYFSNSGGGVSNDPSVAFIRSVNGGSSWTATAYLTPNDTAATQYAMPTMTVDPAGNLWITAYNINVSSGDYWEDGWVSTNAGLGFSGEFRVSDTASLPNIPWTNAIDSDTNLGVTAPIDIYGFGSGLTANTNGTFASWADCRDSFCENGYDLTLNTYTEGVYFASLHFLNATTNLSALFPVDLTVDSIGASQSGTLPQTFVVDGNASVQAFAPALIPDNTSNVWGFDSWGGTAIGTTNSTTFTAPQSSSTVTAGYVPRPSAYITGFVGPLSSHISVTVNGIVLSLSRANAGFWSFNDTVLSGGLYTVDISGGIYYNSWSKGYTPGPHQYEAINVTLVKTNGTLSGNVCTELTQGTCLPANATVTLNNTPLTLNNGAFSDTTVWGYYTLNVTDTGYSSATRQVTVTPFGTTPIPAIVLYGGNVTGTVSPLTATVKVDGTAIAVSTGSFFQGVPFGWHNITATAPGYSFFHKMLDVTTLASEPNVAIDLTQYGWLNGTVTPVGAKLQVNGQFRTISSTTGVYNLSLIGDKTYELEAVLTGYNTTFRNVTVSPGNNSFANITMNKTATCTGSNCGTQITPPNTGSNSTPANNDLLLYAGIGIAIIVVAALAVVLLMRRGRGGSGSVNSSTGVAEYDESTIQEANPPS